MNRVIRTLLTAGLSLAGRIMQAYSARVATAGGVTEATACATSALVNLDRKFLLQSATFVLIPSGYKAAVLYAELPQNGNGDFVIARTSTATRVNSAGLIESVGANVPRLDYSLGGCPSALLEPQRTNSIRNSTMVGAVVGSPGTLPTNYTISPFNVSGLSRSVVGIGSENGLQYVDIRFNGIATGTAFSIAVDTNIPASPLQIFANSMYLRYVSSPSLPNSSNLITNFFNNTTFISSQITNISITTTLTRFVGIHTASSSTLNVATAMLTFILTNGQSYDFTIRVAQPQIELGSFATTPIFTTGTSATRIADTFARNNIYTNDLIGASGFTWFVELKNNIALIRDASGSELYIGEDNSSSVATLKKSIAIRNSGGSARLNVTYWDGVTLTPIYTTQTDSLKLVITYNGTTLNIYVAGNSTPIVTSTFSITLSNLQYLNALSGVSRYISQMALWNTPLSGVQCAALTS